MKKIFQAFLAVTSAMFGVRSSKGLKEDEKLSIIPIIVTAFLMVLFFIIALITFINFVVLV